MSIGSRIKQRREELGYTQPQLAALVGVSKGTIGNYESGVSSPNEDILFKLFDILKCDANFLYQDHIDFEEFGALAPIEKTHIKKYRTLDEYGKKAVDGVLDVEHERCVAKKLEEQPKAFEIPFSELPVSAGTGEFLSDEMTSIIEIPDTPFNRTADYVVQISGDSMEPDYEDEDLILVRKQPQVYEGEIGIFVLNGQGYVKKFGGDRLISLNDAYEDIILHEYDRMDCFGKVIGKV